MKSLHSYFEGLKIEKGLTQKLANNDNFIIQGAVAIGGMLFNLHESAGIKENVLSSFIN